MKRRRAIAACALAITMSIGQIAHADPTPAEIESARKLFKQAETDEAAQKWDTALDELRRASAIKMTAGLRFHIALCENNLNQLSAALADYTAADLLARAESNTEVQLAVRDPLTDLRARVPSLRLTAPADAKDLEVRVDGTLVTDPSQEIRVDPGAHKVEAKASGRKPFAKDLTVKERDVVPIAIDLPLAAPPPAPPAPAPEAPRGRNRVPAILATAGAVVLVGVGVGAFVVAGGAQSDARDACTSGSADCDSKKSSVHVWDTVALVSWVGAAGAAGLAVVLWAEPAPAQGSQNTAQNGSKSLRVGVGPGALRLEGSF